VEQSNRQRRTAQERYLRFASKVGDLLTMGSARDAEKQPLKFYV